jgi:hypothetical protein
MFSKNDVRLKKDNLRIGSLIIFIFKLFELLSKIYYDLIPILHLLFARFYILLTLYRGIYCF